MAYKRIGKELSFANLTVPKPLEHCENDGED